MKYSLCIEPVWEKIDFYDRIKLAKDAGMDAIEFWDPADYDCKKIGSIAANAGIPISDCCINKAWTIRMSWPWEVVGPNVELSLNYAEDLNTKTLIGLSDDLKGHADCEKIALIENLKRAAEMAEKKGVTIVLEALNSNYNHKGYWLDSAYVGFEIVKAVNSPNIKLLYDVYHMQLMEGNLINTITDNIKLIGHFHSAGVPGRNELRGTEVNYPAVIAAAEKAGYDRYFGFEYWPTFDDTESVKDNLAYVKGN
ncbi:MAG: TIM barrel protein [Lachnospiraceae bacterium]|nr:TIM barrel protein [Lachnospiraceae bacterium]